MSQPSLYFASGGLAILVAVGVSRLVGSWAVDLNAPEMQHEHVSHSMVSPEAVTAIAAAINQVTIDNFTFSPQSLVVPVGTTVTWVNRDDIPHTIKDTANVF
ncbi:MAG TPA: hypothetical protein VHU84_01770, partial [Lacipirellulaceae bacterium]|nr:hypothetical protein [Lacipirellulaceae bacterium]